VCQAQRDGSSDSLLRVGSEGCMAAKESDEVLEGLSCWIADRYWRDNSRSRGG
jgi:hypothetical protein